ncbi:MAG: Na+/H+ antiporter NhaA [Rubrivivax sp. SCN 70-15]|nr:MAG: Na+/H+ antiporter NhaA [Rubrivivax sp. SCN 70-15]
MDAANASSWVSRSPERISGPLTLAAMLVALVTVNSPLRPLYDAIHHTPVGIRVGGWDIERPLILWINEGLMVFFFLLVALEIKREVLQGHLASRARVALPLISAVGGMVVPAVMYLAFTWRDPAAARGWPIPMATDTVLALAALRALGARVPAAVVAFLTATAIFDDLGAIAVLALLFSQSISTPALLAAAAAGLGLALINRLGVTRLSAYLLGGLALWAAVLASGVHATVAGFVIGLAVPLRSRRPERSPLLALERGLKPWVALVIVPVFALFNAGIRIVDMAPGTVVAGVVAGTALALALGKPAGILATAWVAVRSGLAQLPSGASWRHVAGAAVLAGIGFTMSLFFAGLAFGPREAMASSATLGVLIGSLLSAVWGLAFLAFVTRRGRRRSVPASSQPAAAAATEDRR